MAAAAKRLLVVGATGQTGLHTLDAALAKGWLVTAFVRQPAKLPPALRASPALSVVEGDVNDSAAVTSVVRVTKARAARALTQMTGRLTPAAQPDALIDVLSSLPTNAKGALPNNASRSRFFSTVLDALRADGRTARCKLVMVGGQLIREPGGTFPSWSVAAMAFAAQLAMPSLFREASDTMQLFYGAPELRFVVVRAGHLVQASSRGTLVPEPCVGGGQRGGVSYVDLGAALVELAGDDRRGAVYVNYERVD